MRLRSLIFALSLVTPIAAGCAPPAPDPDPVGNTTQEIKNGSDAAAYPEAALIDWQDGSGAYSCSGSIIAPQVVLTAGHCVFQASNWTVRAPYVGKSAHATSGVTYDWTNTSETVNPNMHDIGLIFLDTPITLSSYPTIASTPVADGTTIVNIGRIRNGHLSNSGLYVGPVAVSAREAQQEGYQYDYAGQDIIESGDSGGPDEDNGGAHIIYAVNSGGGQSEVLARVDLLYSWIQQQIASPTGSSTSVTTGAGGSSGGTCQDCANSAFNGACGGDVQACENNQDCVGLYNCIQGCGSDNACVQTCAGQYPNGITLYNNINSCICGACSSPCASECGSSSSTTTGAGAGSTTGVGVGVGVGAGTGGLTTATTGTLSGGVGGAAPSGGAGGAGGGGLNADASSNDGGCNFGGGSDSPWSVALLGLALAATAARRRRS